MLVEFGSASEIEGGGAHAKVKMVKKEKRPAKEDIIWI